MAVRRDDGRPGEGMRPRVTRPGGSEVARAVTTVIVESEPHESIELFRHIFRKTHDPRTRHREALAYLSSDYYQHPENFSDLLMASFAADSATAAALLALKRCVLEFKQGGQAYRVPCDVRELSEDETPYQAAFWHNKLFNPAMPADLRILAFRPDWPAAKAEPAS